MGSRVREGRKARGRSRARGRVEHRMEIGWEGDEKKDGREQMGEKE